MRRRVILALALATLATACQLPDFEIHLFWRGKNLLVVPTLQKASIFGIETDDENISADEVLFTTRAQTLWSTYQYVGSPNCAQPARHPFPIVYGETPKCFRDRVPAKPLPQNVWIRVETHGFRSSCIFIRLEGVKIEAREWREDDAPNDRWYHDDQTRLK